MCSAEAEEPRLLTCEALRLAFVRSFERPHAGLGKASNFLAVIILNKEIDKYPLSQVLDICKGRENHPKAFVGRIGHL